MRLSVAVLTATLLTGPLMACSNGYGVPQTTSISADDPAQTHVSVLPVQLRSSEVLAKIHARAGRGGADAAALGIYATSARMNVVYGYPFNDRSNGPPVCSAGPVSSPKAIAVDRKGDLLVADGTNTIIIFKGPGLCGPKLGSIADPFGGEIQDVASRDGKTIVAAYDPSLARHNGVMVCTLSGGCTRHLHIPGWHHTNGVAVANNGDCWASGTEPNGYEELAYFAHCSHKGVIVTGLQNRGVSGLDIDANGNLVTVAAEAPPKLYIYSGCNPACTLVNIFPLKGTQTTYGHLDGNSNKFVYGEDFSAILYVYSYSPSGVKYLYSITNGLHGQGLGVRAAFSPSSKE